MGFFGYFKKGIDLAMLKGDVAEEIAADPESFVPAIIFFVAPSFVISILFVLIINFILGSGMGNATGFPPQAMMFLPIIRKASYGLVIIFVLLALLGSIIGVGFLNLVAKLFKGEGTFLNYYQTMGIGSLVSWGGVVPYIGFLFSIWSIVVAVVVTARVHKLSTGKAVAVVLMPVILFGVLGIALAIMIPVMLMGAHGGMPH